jgi:hypothetical protein
MAVAIVCGGREFGHVETERRAIQEALRVATEMFGITWIAQGGARGVDAVAKRWAKAVDMPCEEHRADWGRLGKAAGPTRNARMLRESGASLVLAFPGGTGTKDMVERAKRAGVPVYAWTGATWEKAE